MTKFRTVEMASLSALSVAVLALSGCAYLNGDAMHLGTKKSVTVSNTLLTWFPTEYEFKDANLPFQFLCKPNNTPYDFGFELPTNSVLKLRLSYYHSSSTSEKDTVVSVSNGVATIRGPKNSAVVNGCKSFWLRISPHRGMWAIGLQATSGNRLIEGKFMPEKMWQTERFAIEECRGVKVRHQSNWYEW